MKTGRFLFIALLLSTAFPVSAKVVINEVAWMGTKASATDEWIELYSDAGPDVGVGVNWNLNGWTLSTADGGLNLKLKNSSSTLNYYLIERTDDNAVPDIKADLVVPFGKGLSNNGEILILKDAGGNEIDRVDGANGWAIGGSAETKETLQRAKNDPSRWITAMATPKAENADYVKKVVQPKSLPTASPRSSTLGVESQKTPSVFPRGGAEAPSNSEYLWLLGGILGGAVIGLACVIIIKWKQNR